uniref:Uncharacterized protein n=1 Tax=Oryza brachyantha TaxID=4533 RepID=J3L0Z3_ORYBR
MHMKMYGFTEEPKHTSTKRILTHQATINNRSVMFANATKQKNKLKGKALDALALGERAPAGGVGGDAGPQPRPRHRAVQGRQRLQPRGRRCR